MKRILQTLFLLVATSCLFAFCSKKDTDTDTPAAAAQKGYVTGKITGPNGQPLAGVTVYASHHTWANMHVIGTTDAAGLYKLKVSDQPGGSWSVYAEHKKTYNGTAYRFDIKPQNTDPLTNDGGVRDMQWTLTGLIPGSTDDTRLGGYLTFFENSPDYIPASEVEFTLTPAGPLVDGSTGAVLVRNASQFPTAIFGFYNNQGVRDVPVGRYKIEVRHKPASGPAQPMVVCRQGEWDYQPSITADFIQESFSSFQELPLNVKLKP